MNNQEKEQKIGQLTAAYAEALNSVNTELIPTFYTEDGVFMPEGFRMLTVAHLLKRGRENYLRRFRFRIDYQIKDLVVDGHYAFVTAIAATSCLAIAILHFNFLRKNSMVRFHASSAAALS